MRRLMLAAAATLALAAASAPALAQSAADSAAQFRATTLNLSAFGEVRIAPDLATITTGVVTIAPTASAAMRIITMGRGGAGV